jgi:hypothetical protein
MEENEDPLIVRVGTFFFVMGGGIFILFVVSDFAENADFDYLFIALLLMSIGWAFRRGKAPPPSAGRFAWLRRKREETINKRRAKEEARKKKS